MLSDRLAPLRDELAIWRDAGLSLPLWWRDDDAVALTPALERLRELASRFDAPLHLAVVPGLAQPDLGQGLTAAQNVRVIPHGWLHQNHAPPTEKKAEFGAHRPLDVMLDEVKRGWQRIQGLFGQRAVPIFAPPWNRACPELINGLGDCGLSAVSLFRPRQAQYAAPGVLEVNTHIDPLAWRSGGGLVDPEELSALIVDQLYARRQGNADNSEPYGLLTHHLAHDEPIWEFVSVLVETLLHSGVARWTPPLQDKLT